MTAKLLEEACSIALAIAGHYHPDTPVDTWLAAHEKRLRELEQIARTAPSAPDAGLTSADIEEFREHFNAESGRTYSVLTVQKANALCDAALLAARPRVDAEALEIARAVTEREKRMPGGQGHLMTLSRALLRAAGEEA